MNNKEAMQMALTLVDDLETDKIITEQEAETLRAALAQGEQEPVAWMCPDDPERETAFSWQSGHCNDCGKQKVPVYTAPPQREWQGLTVEEAVAIYKTIQAESSELEFAKAIEAKLKEKNT